MEKFEDSAEISVTFVDNEQIRELNAQYRNKDAATDVLSFPMGENGVYDINHDTGAKILGDIVLSVEMAMAQAKRYGHSLEREIGYLTAHSMLHLLGYDHENGGMERFFGCKINLRLWVKVKEDWRQRPQILTKLGFNEHDFDQYQ